MATLAIFSIRRSIMLTALLPVIGLCAGLVIAGEQSSNAPIEPAERHSAKEPLLESLPCFNWAEFGRFGRPIRIEMPRRFRVSRSQQPLRIVCLVGGDRFLGELLEWKSDHCSFRLLSGNVIQIPTAAIGSIRNPPGEVDLVDESFDENGARRMEIAEESRSDDVVVAGKHDNLKRSGDTQFEKAFPSTLASARIEASFQVIETDPSVGSGEWTLTWASDGQNEPSITVRVGPNRVIHVAQLVPNKPASVQSLPLAKGRHTFIALVTPERTRLIIDDANLAVLATPGRVLKSIQFRAGGNDSKNRLELDSFQVRQLDATKDQLFSRDDSLAMDMLTFATGDQLFGRVSSLDRQSVRVEAFDTTHVVSWTRLAGVCFAQRSLPVQQKGRIPSGVEAEVEMDLLTDRPECLSERWTGTIVDVDENQILLHQPLIGSISLQWAEIRRINPRFFGRSLLVDGRRFHLGNSIRSDFQRQLPDGTDVHCEIILDEIPEGKCNLALEVAELEASGVGAPPASPFLAELRDGSLTTEVFVNDQRVGDLNSQIRFKATALNPERVDLAIPSNLLKIGRNSIRLQQRSKKDSPREFDDCEVGNIRLEFVVAEGR